MPQPWKYKPKPLELGSETIPERLKRLRKLRGMTQSQLADKIGISRGLLASYEYGQNRLFDEMIIRFAIALRISTDMILGISDLPHDDFISIRFIKRLRELERLPENKKKTIISNLDDLIRANS